MATNADIARLRLANQLISSSRVKEPSQTVERLGAVQAQDYLASLWAVGLRTPKSTERDVEKALADGTILRTWPMRGTIHLVPPADARWMLELLTPRVVAGAALRLRRAGIDARVIAQCEALVVAALRGGQSLTRPDLYKLFQAAHIATSNMRGLFILQQLTARGVICFAGRKGRQPAFALLSEWAPTARSLPREQALAVLTRRYFMSHGPATVRDFAWWTGLTAAHAEAGVEMVQGSLQRIIVDGKTYWMGPARSTVRDRSPAAYLLPGFDEFLVGYADRGAVIDPDQVGLSHSMHNWLSPAIIVDGRVAGAWKRTLANSYVAVEIKPFSRLSRSGRGAVAEAAERYGAFLGKHVKLIFRS